MVEFAEKASERSWGEERLRNYLEKTKKKFFLTVDSSDDLKYNGFHIVGIENPFPEGKNISKKFVNLEKWMEQNKNFIKYTEFTSYRKPVGSHNSCLGSNSGLGTICLSHFELEKGNKIEEKLSMQKGARKGILKVFNDKQTGKVGAHVRAIDDKILQELKIDRAKLAKLYKDFFNDLFSEIPEESFKETFKHEVVIFNGKILGIKQEDKGKKEGDGNLFEYPKYFNGQNQKKPFLIESRTRPFKKNLLISKYDQNKIHEFMVKILPEIGTPFILPLDGKLQKKIADDIAYNEKSFFKTVENLLDKKDVSSGTVSHRFDFYFVDIRKQKIQFFDYVSNYQYDFPKPYGEIFPLGTDTRSTSFNRRNLNENFSKIFGQNNLPCLPWADIPKNMNTSKKSAYIQLREKMFETLYLGKTVLTQVEIEGLCLILIEDSIINEGYGKAGLASNACLNFFINSYLYTIGGETVGNTIISKAEKIEEQISKKVFKPTDKESGFYLLGLLLKRLCDKSETSNEKSRLLQPIINTHTISGLNRAVTEKFVEKYAYKINENDSETASLVSNVLPFFAEQNPEEPIKDFKLWLYAGFFSNHEGR